MITSKLEPSWRGDVVIGDRYPECGLRVPSLIRTVKVATTDLGRAEVLGCLPEDLWEEVRRQVWLHLG